ncbi:MAG TPA: hypothetical protein VFN36_00105 [Solirubrobacteraceae bacterium]|nr:hypothetical protein [Solirubrobacteraceae bacterium]
MSELGSSAAVGIESVEWLDAGGGQLTVRVTGRWRRRRGWVESRGQTMLVVEAEGRRHRFPATPEPPSLSGVAPGTWRLSFAVPAELAHGLRGHVWLALGTVTVPLSVPDSAAGPAADREPAGAPPVERAPAAAAREAAAPPAPEHEPAVREGEREPAGLEIERAWRRADAAERTAGELGERISALERALERERAERERALQAVQVPPLDPAGAEQARLRAEAALRVARRAADVRVPAEPSLPAAGAAAVTAGAGEARGAGTGAGEAGVGEAGGGAAGSALRRPGPGAGPAGERETILALRRELNVRVAAEAGLRARTVQAETRLAARVLLEQRTADTLAELRTELERLREALERERELRRAAEASAARVRMELGGQRERSREAHTAIQELRSALEQLRPGETPAPTAGEPVTPDRLSDALARLRQNAESREGGGAPAERRGAPAEEGAPAPVAVVAPTSATASPRGADAGAPVVRVGTPVVRVGAPTLEPPFRRLLSQNPERAGRLLIGLLGAQHAAWPQAIAYDLVLGAGYGTVQVTAGERGVSVERSGAARGREQVGFQIVGDPGRLARLLGAGPLRRALRIGLARVRGRREGLAALRALLALPLDLDGLRRAGVALDGETLFTLLAAMIDPAWTRGELFTVAHTDERGHAVYLQIRNGAPPLVSLEPPAGRLATELAGASTGLWQAFGDGRAQAWPADGLIAAGDQGPLTLLRTWANRAQSGHSAR